MQNTQRAVEQLAKLELIMGFNLAGAIKAILAGFVLVTVGSVIAGIPDPLKGEAIVVLCVPRPGVAWDAVIAAETGRRVQAGHRHDRVAE